MDVPPANDQELADLYREVSRYDADAAGLRRYEATVRDIGGAPTSG